MKPTAAASTPYVSHLVQARTGQPSFSFPPPPGATLPPLSWLATSFFSSSSSTSSASSSALPRLDGPARPLRKRNREPLQPASAASFDRQTDPAKVADAFRTNLRSAAQLPDGALEGLVRNLVTERLPAPDLADLHLLLDVLVQERDRMTPDQVGQALQGLAAGLGGADMATSLVEVLVDRVVCMGFGTPGRCLQEDLRALTTVLVQGEHRLDRLSQLVDLVMDTGQGLRVSRLGEALAGIAQGLQAVSTPGTRIDLDLHQRMLSRLLQPAQERTNTQVRAGLIALWTHLAQAGALTPAMRNTVINQVFDCREAAGPRLLSSACKVLVECLSRRGDAEAHRTAVLATLVRESTRMTAEETFQAALGFGSGLGGLRIDARTRAWMAEWLVKLQRLHPAAGWTRIYAGLAYTPPTDDPMTGDKAHGSQRTVQPAVPPARVDDDKALVSSSAVDVQALWEALALDDTAQAAASELRRDAKHSPVLEDALDLERREATAYLGWRDRYARSQRTLASSIPDRSQAMEDLVPPRDQAGLHAIMAGRGKPQDPAPDA